MKVRGDVSAKKYPAFTKLNPNISGNLGLPNNRQPKLKMRKEDRAAKSGVLCYKALDLWTLYGKFIFLIYQSYERGNELHLKAF